MHSLTVVGVGVVSDVNMEVAVALSDVVNGHRAVGGATRIGVHSAGGGSLSALLTPRTGVQLPVLRALGLPLLKLERGVMRKKQLDP